MCFVAQLPPANVRQLRAKMGGLALAAKADPRIYTAPARAAALARFEREVDPQGVLPLEERARRAEAARKLHFTGLALASAKARSKNKTAEAPPASAIEEAIGSGTTESSRAV